MSDTLGLRFEPENANGLTRQPTMAKKIFEKLYRIRVPEFYSRTVDDIRRNGVMISGIKEYDNSYKEAWITKDQTINQMVELFRRNVSIRVVKYSDTKDIYDTIQTHLMQWYEVIRKDMNVGNAPIDDLMLLDKFAAKVYDKAKHFFTPEIQQSMFGSTMSTGMRVNMSNFFTNIDPVNGRVKIYNPVEGKAERPKADERVSFEERFKQSVDMVRRY
jgi:hypothetical protein